jgi:predicted 2-oxoglutarate/Fe(II)-dependent dioxygenase YbiX
MNEFLFIKQLPPEVVDIANREFDALEVVDAQVVRKYESVTNYENRDSSLRFPEFGHWFSGIMYQFGVMANDHWALNVDGQQIMQIAEYAEGQHFDWHMDVIPFSGPTDRKVSVICLLTDPDEYVGGLLQVQHIQDDNDVRLVPLKKGTMVAFPSVLRHRVTPVVQGVRRSATLWLTGPCFR